MCGHQADTKKNSTLNHGLLCNHCNYDLIGIALTDRCPECGTPILKDCSWCGYDLSDTPPDYACPECGVPALTSAGSGSLSFATSTELDAIYLGFKSLTITIVTGIGLVVAMVLGLLINSRVELVIEAAFYLTVYGLFFAGMFCWWKMTTPLQALPTAIDGSSQRKRVRTMHKVLVVTIIVLSVMYLIPQGYYQFVSGTVVDIVDALVFIFFSILILVVYFYQMQYLIWFSSHARNVKIKKQAARMIWVGPLVVIFVLFIGPLIALLLYLDLILSIQKNVKLIRATRIQ